MAPCLVASRRDASGRKLPETLQNHETLEHAIQVDALTEAAAMG
jgi:hypothetical protein